MNSPQSKKSSDGQRPSNTKKDSPDKLQPHQPSMSLDKELEELLILLGENNPAQREDIEHVAYCIKKLGSQKTTKLLEMMDVMSLKKYQDYFMSSELDLDVWSKLLQVLGKKLKPRHQEWMAEFANEEIRWQLIKIWGDRLSPFSVWYLIKKGSPAMHQEILKLFGGNLELENQLIMVSYAEDELILQMLDALKSNLDPNLQQSLADYCGEDVHNKLLDIMGSNLDPQARDMLMESSESSIKPRLKKMT